MRKLENKRINVWEVVKGIHFVPIDLPFMIIVGLVYFFMVLQGTVKGYKRIILILIYVFFLSIVGLYNSCKRILIKQPNRTTKEGNKRTKVRKWKH